MSILSRPRKRATRSKHCGISNSMRSALPNNTTAARNNTPSRKSPSPRREILWVPIQSLLQSASLDRLCHRASNFSYIQIIYCPSRQRVDFPNAVRCAYARRAFGCTHQPTSPQWYFQPDNRRCRGTHKVSLSLDLREPRAPHDLPLWVPAQPLETPEGSIL